MICTDRYPINGILAFIIIHGRHVCFDSIDLTWHVLVQVRWQVPRCSCAFTTNQPPTTTQQPLQLAQNNNNMEGYQQMKVEGIKSAAVKR